MGQEIGSRSNITTREYKKTNYTYVYSTAEADGKVVSFAGIRYTNLHLLMVLD